MVPGRVIHGKYGRGSVLRREGSGDNVKLTVTFPDSPEKADREVRKSAKGLTSGRLLIGGHIMSFDPKTLPPTVQAAYRQGPLAWALVVESCLRTGIEDPVKLTDIVFYLHHPERLGRPLLPTETTLIKQWKGFRTLIMPRAIISSSNIGCPRVPMREDTEKDHFQVRQLQTIE
jgi:hypothetical protein